MQQIRRIPPLLAPVVVQAIVGGEETIDAMDLRSFGVRPRTWLTRLTYHRADYVLLGLSALILVASTVVTLSGYGRFWLPPAFLR